MPRVEPRLPPFGPLAVDVMLPALAWAGGTKHDRIGMANERIQDHVGPVLFKMLGHLQA